LENQNILEEEDHIRLIDYLRGHISPAQNEQSQILAMEYILKMPNLYRRGREVLEATLLVSKSGSQVVKDLGKKVHQTFSRYKLPNDHWKEAEEVFGENLVK